MFKNLQQSFLWDHTLAGDSINISFDNNRNFSVSISAQVLKLASRYASQCSKDVVSCVLIGSCNNEIYSKLEITVDRIECNLTSYLSDNQLICSDDICIPLKCFKSKDNLNYLEEDFLFPIKEIIHNLEDPSYPLSLSKFISLRVYAGFNNFNKSSSPNFNWIELKLMFPDLNLTLSPINKLSVFRSALISSFENNIFSNQIDNLITFGYLTMDQSNKLHFLLHSDDRVLKSSLVGVWIHGAAYVSDLSLFATCAKYICLQKLKNRLCKPPFPFILAQFIENQSNPIKFFDVKWPMGPSEDQDSVLKFINFKLYSGVDNLDKYFLSSNDNQLSCFIAKLSTVSINDRAMTVLSKAAKSYLSENCKNFVKDDTMPRNTRSHWKVDNTDNTSEFTGLDVPDVSLIGSDMSANSNNVSISSITQFPSSEHIKLDISGTTDKPVKLISNVTVHPFNEVDEAVPRPLLHKQRIMPSNYQPVMQEETFKPCYPQMQYFPQTIFPYQTVMPPNYNPYMMFTPNLLVANREQPPVIVSKPPRPHKVKESTIKKPSIINKAVDIENQKSKKPPSHARRTTVNKCLSQTDKAVITDVTNQTNKLSKRILQLDREEDLATLEHLVQQIINQRHQTKPEMISTATNTSKIYFDKPRTNIVEISTDLPSFFEMKTCKNCKQRFDEEFSDQIDSVHESINILNDNHNESLSSDSTSHSILSSEERNVSKDDHENISDENQHYTELLKNLETFVQQVRHNSSQEIEPTEPNDASDSVDQSKINVLEEAVRNLQELDIDRDFENQYWETVRSSKPQLFNNSPDFNNQMGYERSSLDATILQQRINYVSLFLNSSTISSPSSGENNNYRKSSISEQSGFIEELAKKYLNKASSKLNKLQESTCLTSTIASHASNNISQNTKAYLQRYNLNPNLWDSDIENAKYYSSIRMPDGNSLPRSKHMISSTPAPHANPTINNCFKKPENYCHKEEASDWSYVKILDGLKQQPSILPAINQSSVNSWSKTNLPYDELDSKINSYNTVEMTNVLDIDKLKQLPKYL